MEEFIAVSRPIVHVALSVSLILLGAFLTTAFAADASSPDSETPDYETLESPVPYSKRSIARGRTLYLRLCPECHGMDGKAQMDVIADGTDLTDPRMPPYKFQVWNEQDIWHMVN